MRSRHASRVLAASGEGLVVSSKEGEALGELLMGGAPLWL